MASGQTGTLHSTDTALLQPLKPNRVQQDSQANEKSSLPELESHELDEGWLPTPLQDWFAIPLIVVMGLAPIILEVLWYTNKKANGWATNEKLASETGIFHYVYTLPPVAVAMVIAALWAWTDSEVKRLQPYVDLFGDLGAPPHKSLLLDYTRTHNFWVWMRAMANGHHVVALTTIIVIVSLPLQPLAAALLTVKDTLWTEPNFTVNNLAAIGLNQGSEFQDLTTFLTSAGYASASVMFNLSDPPFTNNGFTVSKFEIPTIADDFTGGSLTVNTSAVLTDPGCRAADSVNYSRRADGTAWDNSATFGSCQFEWTVNRTAVNLFGADLATNCTEFSSEPGWFQPIIYWAFTYSPTPRGSITMCQPRISLWDVTIEMDLASHNISSVTRVRPFAEGTSKYSGFAGNVTALNGQAYNGIIFNVSNGDPFVTQREQAIQFSLPAAIFQATQNSPKGLFAALADNTMVELSSKVYTTYLALVGLETYFVQSTEPMQVNVQFTRKRVWFTSVATHLLVADLLVLFFLGLIVYILHHPVRTSLRLRYQPGTIASAVSMAGGTALGSVLAGVQREEEFSSRLQDKRFRLNPITMKIAMEGEADFDEAPSPGPRPVSMFAKMAKGQDISGLTQRLFRK